VRRTVGLAFQRLHDHRLDPRVIDLARRAGARFILQAFQAMHEIPPAPFADRHRVHPELGGDVLVLHPARAGQNNPSSQGKHL
jgi:hypothetical protein